MADALVRLKVESQEYDAKIKRATEGLTRYADECRKAGGTLEYVEKETLEYVRSLGNMETVSKTTKGKIAELKNAYQELGVQYKQLTAAEKNSPYGQALAGSLQQLKGRFTELSGQLNTTNTELGYSGLSGIFDKIAGKIGVPTNLLKDFGAAAAVVASAAKLAGDAMKQNELVVDEWGRTTQAAQSLYKGFLNALNTGNISGYLRNISDIVNAARDAYDAMDELGTFNAFNQINKERARTNFTQAIADYRDGTISKDQAKAAGEAFKKEIQAQADKELAAYNTAVTELAKERKVDPEMLRKALSGTYGDYETLKNTKLTGSRIVTKSAGMAGTYSYEEAYAANEVEELGEMLRALTDEELNNLQALGAQAQRTATEVASVDRQMVRFLGAGNRGTNNVATPDLSMLDAQRVTVAALQKQWDEAGVDGATNKLWNDLEEGKRKLEEMEQAAAQLGRTLQSSFSVEAPAQLNTELEKVHISTRTVGADTTSTALGTGKAWSMAAASVATVGSALQQIEDPAAKVAGIVAVAIAQVAAGLGQMLAMPQSTAQSWGWIALAATGTATMISTITAIKAATSGFAEGGMVLPNGNPYGGDNIVARLNAGEGVLTARGIRTAEAMGQLQAAPIRIGGTLSTKIKGGDILIALDNTNRSRGGSRGVYARTK